MALLTIFVFLSPALADDNISSIPEPSSQEKLNNTFLTDLTFLIGEHAYISLYSTLTVNDVNKFWHDVHTLIGRGIEYIHLFVCSPGGDAFSAFALADQIDIFKKNGMIFIGHASGLVASAAIPIFASCSIRLAGPNTVFMIHEASAFTQSAQRSSDISSTNDLMNIIESSYNSILSKNSNLSSDEWKSKARKTKWFNVTDALEWGLVDEIEGVK